MNSDGRVLHNRYQLEYKLGGGAMGTVWLARDLELLRSVALKELVHADRLALAERKARAVREARALAKVSHPAIVTIHDIFYVHDEPWLVMDYIPGPSLKDIIHARGRLGEQETTRIGLPVLQGLCAAHEAGVVHRDIKPANIVVTDNGKVVLVDFGIAKISGDMTLTDQNRVWGTPEFLAPEQVYGRRVTGAADVWALGVTFFCALEGYSPFQRPRGNPQPTATMMAIVTEELPRLRSRGRLAEVVVQLLQKEPDNRLPALKLVDVLESMVGQELEPTSPDRPAPRLNPRPLPRPLPEPALGAAVNPMSSRPFAPSDPALQGACERLRKAEPQAGADILLSMSEQRAAATLADCEPEVGGKLLTAIAATQPLIAGSILRMLKLKRAGAVVNNLTPSAAAAILEIMPIAEARRILSQANTRNVAEVIMQLPRGIARQLVHAMPSPQAAKVLRYVKPVVVADLVMAADGPNYALLAQLDPAVRDQAGRYLSRGTGQS